MGDSWLDLPRTGNLVPRAFPPKWRRPLERGWGFGTFVWLTFVQKHVYSYRNNLIRFWARATSQSSRLESSSCRRRPWRRNLSIITADIVNRTYISLTWEKRVEHQGKAETEEEKFCNDLQEKIKTYEIFKIPQWSLRQKCPFEEVFRDCLSVTTII